MLILNRNLIKLIVLLFLSFQTHSSLAQSDLLFPVKPGVTNTLAGTMGELRSSHFHTGIDIRTGGQEGVDILAADDGYIFRISVNPGGYGNAIYIKHPNGHTTVYAHLKSFRKDIGDYVRKQQYAKKKFKLNVFPDGGLFKVKRGDIIALSGNSGSSGGPHLHFDVRNRNQDLLNPLHYGFAEIIDIRPPLAKNLALVTSTIDSRVNGHFGRIEIPFEYEKNNYFINDTIYAIGRIGLELYAYDRMDNTRFKTGINKIEIRVNGKIHLITSIDTWPFSKARQFYTYINYEALINNSKRYHKLYVDEGNTLDFYSMITDNGYYLIEQNGVYAIDIELTDAYNNKSNVNFVIKGSNNTKRSKNTLKPNPWRVDKHILTYNTNPNDTVAFYAGGHTINQKPTYSNKINDTYLWNLTTSIPDYVLVNGRVYPLNIKAYIPAGVAYKFYNSVADIQFAKNTLFSNLYFTFNAKVDTTTGFEIITIGNSNIPLNKNYSVTLKPANLPANKENLAVYSVWGKNSSFIGGKWAGNRISFKSRSFGSYTLLADSIPPTTKPLILNKDEMVFKISDNLSGIAKITMLVNGEWVLMNYDPKKSLIWAEKPNTSFSFKGKIELTVKDNVGNEAVHSTKLK
ncbi:MAG: M23 family metallopeptidase [Cyclobacteriaceae bacterium]|nr:M23 family metallopeptidase [Cyclobacteriaceae bacterium]